MVVSLCLSLCDIGAFRLNILETCHVGFDVSITTKDSYFSLDEYMDLVVKRMTSTISEVLAR